MGAFLFLIFISIAVEFYGGGNIVNPSEQGYSFIYNYWSDLGMTVAWSGGPNLTSRIFFTLAMVIWGLTFFPSILALPSLFSETARNRWFVKVGQIFAFLCVALLFIVVIFFPLDTHTEVHGVLAGLGYGALFFFELLYAYAMGTDEKYPSKYAICFVAVAVAIAIFTLINIGLTQKIVTFSLIIATVIVFSHALKESKARNDQLKKIETQ